MFNFLKKKCCFCKGFTGLTTVVHPGYDITYHHFHQSCLHGVLSNPEENQHKVDLAIQIADELKKDLHKSNEKFQKALKLKDILFQDKVPPPPENSDVILQSRFELLKEDGSHE